MARNAIKVGFAMGIVALFLLSAVVGQVDADKPVADYYATQMGYDPYPDVWVDPNVTELNPETIYTIGEMGIGVGYDGSGNPTMDAHDDENSDGADYQEYGMVGRHLDLSGPDTTTASYLDYQNGKHVSGFYQISGLTADKVPYTPASGDDQGPDDNDTGSYNGMIWKDYVDGFTVKYELHRFKAQPVDIDQYVWTTPIWGPIFRPRPIAIILEPAPQPVPGDSVVAEPNDGYQDLVMIQDRELQPYPGLPQIEWGIIGYRTHYQVRAVMDFKVECNEWDGFSGWNEADAEEYRFEGLGPIYSQTYWYPRPIYGYNTPLCNFEAYDVEFQDSCLQNTKAGRTLPIKFTAEQDGEPVFDEDVEVHVYTSNGEYEAFSAEFGEGKESIRYDDATGEYIVNWKTTKDMAGDYIIVVGFGTGFQTDLEVSLS
jgi:hypothetical protein